MSIHQPKANEAFANNPLYLGNVNVDYANLKPEDADVIAEIITENREAIEHLVHQDAPTWESLIQPLERMENRLALAVSPISHLHSVLSTDEWRGAYEKMLPILTDYGTDMAQHKPLYEAVKKLRDGTHFSALSATQKKIVTDMVADFERSGVGLDDAKKAEFKKNSQRLSELSTQFSNNVLDATNAWHLLLPDDTRLAGLPESSKALLQALAQQHEQQGYRITLDAPVVIPVLSYADDCDLRETVYRAYNARASELANNGQYDNQAIIAEIRELRQKQAEILGFEDYAQLATASNRMAKTPEAVFAFLQNLVDKSHQAGIAEINELQHFAKSELNLPTLAPWDVSYAVEKLRQKQYALSQEDLRPYFPLSKTLEGLFAITHKLFGVTFQENTTRPVWHKNVQAFDVLNTEGNVIAGFYLDPYAREKKRAGAWMDSAVGRFNDNGKLQLPVAYLVCNFTPPVGEDESYITHDEVTTLFHEFGHGLHHMLTQVDEYSASGINGVEWDAVEQPSQFMENFCFDRECLTLMTHHKESGEPLPDDLYHKLISAKNFNSAMVMLRQLEFSLFDMRVHTAQEANREVLDILQEVRQKVAVTPSYEHNRFPMQFSHIFAGGYSAGYYSYKWAEVLSADSFSAFEEEGVLNPETGARFRDNILAVGSSRPSMESFVAFRGREPKVDALLKHNGIQ